MENTQAVSPIRGAIKTSVSTSTDTLVAGQDFSIFIKVQNPFEMPLILHRVSTYIPTEFIDVDKKFRDIQALELEEQIADLESVGSQVGLPPSGFIPRHRIWLPKFFRGLSQLSLKFLGLELEFNPERVLVPSIARDASETAETKIGLKLPFMGHIAQAYKKEVKNNQDEESTKTALRERLSNELAIYHEALKSLMKPDQSFKILQAGNSTTRVFTIRSGRTIRFTPASYRLHIEVEYEIAGIRNVDTIEHILQVKSSLASIVLGALLGGLGGWFTSNGKAINYDLLSFVELFISLVMASMAVVLFARKKDVQPFIAVEDFWGGIAIGFLVAYSGPKLFQKIVSAGPTS